METQPNDLLKLWSMSGKDYPKDSSKQENDELGAAGIYLLAPLENWSYWCTPINTVTFASTKTDGVHFGFLVTDEKISDSSPIVMTVPMSSWPNVIVGENLRDFLALGCEVGYSYLDGLVHRREWILDILANPQKVVEAEEEKTTLEKIKDAFNFRPWSDDNKKLQELHDKHFEKLVFSQEMQKREDGYFAT